MKVLQMRTRLATVMTRPALVWDQTQVHFHGRQCQTVGELGKSRAPVHSHAQQQHHAGVGEQPIWGKTGPG